MGWGPNPWLRWTPSWRLNENILRFRSIHFQSANKQTKQKTISDTVNDDIEYRTKAETWSNWFRFLRELYNTSSTTTTSMAGRRSPNFFSTVNWWPTFHWRGWDCIYQQIFFPERVLNSTAVTDYSGSWLTFFEDDTFSTKFANTTDDRMALWVTTRSTENEKEQRRLLCVERRWMEPTNSPVNSQHTQSYKMASSFISSSETEQRS